MTFDDFTEFRLACRQKLINFILIFLAVAGGSLFLIVYSVSKQASDLDVILVGSLIYAIPALIIISFFTAFAYQIIARRERANYEKAYKAYFVSRVFSETFDHYKFNHTSGIPAETIANTYLIREWDSYSANDLVTGSYHGVDFSQCDIHAQEVHTDSEGKTSKTTIFHGRWLIFDFHKKTTRLKIIGRKFRNSTKPGNKSLIKLESASFNHAFKVFGQDEVEARYILTPDLMERLEQLAIRYHYKILFGFIDNQLHIAIGNKKDSFEPPSPLKNIDESAELAKVAADTKLITDIIDTLKLHNY